MPVMSARKPTYPPISEMSMRRFAGEMKKVTPVGNFEAVKLSSPAELVFELANGVRGRVKCDAGTWLITTPSGSVFPLSDAHFALSFETDHV